MDITTTPATVNRLAQHIREIDGNHTKGAGEIAEGLIEKGWQAPPAPASVRVSITFDVDPDMPITWAGLRDLIRYYTPMSDNLKLADRLSAPIAARPIGGILKIDVTDI